MCANVSRVFHVAQDNCSGQHLNILRYFMAEGVACKQVGSRKTTRKI